VKRSRSDNNSDALWFASYSATKRFDTYKRPSLCRAEVDEHYLVFTMVDNGCQRLKEQHAFRRRKDAAKNGILQRLSVPTHGAMDAPEPLWIGDIIGNNVTRPHGTPLQGTWQEFLTSFAYYLV
jgi:hypothetical protein